MFKLSAAEIESSTQGTLVQGTRETVFAGVSIDTRTLTPGSIFFAIRGPNQDGHCFITDALAKGALGAVVEQGYEHPSEFPNDSILIKVEDTHRALKSLARAVRLDWPGTLVAITGSMGKTTTREFAAQLMQSKFPVYQTPGNYNNLFGLPLTLFGLSSEYQMGIFEMGMSVAGEISEMCRIATPTIGIITNVAPVHLEFFDSIEQIAQAKGELAEGLPPDGTLIYNIEDPFVRNIAARFSGRKISFGISDMADIRAENIGILDPDKTRFQLSYDGHAQTAFLPFAGSHYVMNALPGIALCRLFNIDPDQIVESLGRLQPVAMRGRIVRFKNGITLIDDSYNSNPRALMQMIEVLAKMPAFSRRILIAGEMRELGGSSRQLHFECGSYAIRQGVDMVVGIEGDAQEIVQAAIESGLPESQAHFFANSEMAIDFINSIVRPGDLLLIKGSRGVHTEKIVKSMHSQFESLGL
jgi:UDP-N-acetylmuramoyl-tripeptide--D-alanyl-D-alanine ligase